MELQIGRLDQSIKPVVISLLVFGKGWRKEEQELDKDVSLLVFGKGWRKEEQGLDEDGSSYSGNRILFSNVNPE